MNTRLLFALATLLPLYATAQDDNTTEPEEEQEGFIFTTIKELPITSIKNQNKSGTCWCFSSLGFFESELLRMGKGEYDLCEMFVVHKTMEDRAAQAVRTHGDVSFSQGGSFYDVLYCLKNYGIVPQEAMPEPGTLYGDTLPDHNELDLVASAYVEAIAGSELKKLSPVWKQGLSAIYDAYIGACPQTFTVDGKEYSPISYMQSLGINPDDYVSLTSYTHHPFYEQFVLEIPDNWRWALSYNLPLTELMEVFDYAINNGYTIAWGSDVSEKGFSRSGIAVIPDLDGTDLTGSDADHWLGLTESEKNAEATSKPSPEPEITQEMRQLAYDNWETTDDHGMQIYGLAQDQTGKEYYMVKNSWGECGDYDGIWYASKAFVAYKTMNIVVHKDAVPKEIRKKLGF